MEQSTTQRESNGDWPLRRYSVVDGGDSVGIMETNGAIVRIPAWTVIGDHLILGAHPADTMPPNIDAITTSTRFASTTFPTAPCICTSRTAIPT
jgi:hypothetical protein